MHACVFPRGRWPCKFYNTATPHMHGTPLIITEQEWSAAIGVIRIKYLVIVTRTPLLVLQRVVGALSSIRDGKACMHSANCGDIALH